MSVRTEIQNQLREDFKTIPELKPVYVLATERALDDVRKVTIIIRQKSIQRAPAAPLSHRSVGVLLTVVSPLLDLDKAADQLDGVLEALFDYLDSRFLYSEATAVAYGDRLAYDIPLTVLASKE